MGLKLRASNLGIIIIWVWHEWIICIWLIIPMCRFRNIIRMTKWMEYQIIWKFLRQSIEYNMIQRIWRIIAFGCIWYEKYGAIWAISQRYGPYRIHNLAIWPYHIFDDVNYGITLNLYIKSMKFAMGFSSCDKISIAFALMWYQPYRLYRKSEWYGPWGIP